ncbi:MAG: hypothetical protein QM725_01410 [Lacibacter sp.]
MKQKKTTKGKASKKKIVIASVAIGVTGLLGYFGWQYLKKKKQSGSTDMDVLLSKIQTPVANTQVYTALQPKIAAVKKTAQSITPARNDAFPLKKGSKGEKVKQLQLALINRYGSSVLPKYGADGDFGSEVVSALKKINMPDTITESMFNVLTQSSKTNTDAATIGKELYKAAITKNLNQTISLLKKLTSSDDYNKANEQFKLGRINGVRQTIVNGLLNSFTKAADKEKIKFEFLRIGLQYDGNKWSLSGIDGRPIVTSTASTVWLNAKESVAVPANTVLGNEVSRRLDYTLFENKGNYFLVESKSVRYL